MNFVPASSAIPHNEYLILGNLNIMAIVLKFDTCATIELFFLCRRLIRQGRLNGPMSLNPLLMRYTGETMMISDLASFIIRLTINL